MHATFRNSFFALLESFTPQLLAGPEARTSAQKQPKLAAGQVGVFGVLGQNDWFTDTDYADVRANIRRALADPSVRTIDLVIDSPGGSVLGLPETADAIHAANRIKPVRSFVSGIAASAAYWLASQASTITLTPSGEVGSVGVLDLHADISKALENAGVKVTAVTAGEHKTERAPFTPLTDSAKEYMQAGVNQWHGDFLAAIRRGRGVRVAPNSNYGGGRMLSSREALSAGMVDFVSSF
ncbi:MAG: S49 family peptidase [Candidatus Sulfotelmatobacter sp.]